MEKTPHITRQRSVQRSLSFAECVPSGRRRSDSLTRTTSRREWLFHKSSAGYNDVLRQTEESLTPVDGVTSPSTSFAQPLNRADSQASDRSNSSRHSTPSIQRQPRTDFPPAPTSPTHNTMVLSPWHGLLGAPLFRDTLGDPLSLFGRLLIALVGDEVGQDVRAGVVANLVVVVHTCDTAVMQGHAAHHNPSEYLKKCRVITESAALGGYTQGSFVATVTSSAATLMQEHFLRRVSEENLPFSDQVVLLEKRRSQVPEGVEDEVAGLVCPIITVARQDSGGPFSSFRVKAASVEASTEALSRASSFGATQQRAPKRRASMSTDFELNADATLATEDGSGSEEDVGAGVVVPLPLPLPPPAPPAPAPGGEGRRPTSLPVVDLTQTYDAASLSCSDAFKADVWDLLRHPTPDDPITSPRFLVTVLQGFVLLSWAVVFAWKSFPAYHRAEPPVLTVFDSCELFFTVFYTAEYVLRLICSPQPVLLVAAQPMQICILVSVLPAYIRGVDRLLGGDMWDVGSFFALVEMLVVPRILKVTMFAGENLRRLSTVIEASKWMLLIGLISLVAFVAVVSNLLFYAEVHISGDNYIFDDTSETWQRRVFPALVTLNKTVIHSYELSPIQSHLDVFWWCLSTVTTVGYGDVVPVTPGGKIVASVCIVMGVLVFAVPASVICSHFTLTKSDRLLQMENRQQHRVRAYIKHICTKGMLTDPDVPIFLYHFVMLDTVEADDRQNPTREEVTSLIYQKLLYLYKAARKSQKQTLRWYLRAEKQHGAPDMHTTAHEWLRDELLSNGVTLAPRAELSRRERKQFVSRLCQKRFMNSCAEVFRQEKAVLWVAYARLKQQELHVSAT